MSKRKPFISLGYRVRLTTARICDLAQIFDFSIALALLEPLGTGKMKGMKVSTTFTSPNFSTEEIPVEFVVLHYTVASCAAVFRPET